MTFNNISLMKEYLLGEARILTKLKIRLFVSTCNSLCCPLTPLSCDSRTVRELWRSKLVWTSISTNFIVKD